MTLAHSFTPIGVEQLELRRLRDADIAQLMSIESVSFGRFFWSVEAFRNELKNHIARYYVLLGEDVVLGYFGYWLVVDEVHITTLAVHPDCRGKSLGEILLAKVIEQAMCHSARNVTLEVRASNSVGQNLYAKYGFEVLGVRPKYYQDNHEDAYIMTSPDILNADYRALFNTNRTQLFEKLSGTPKGFAGP